MEYIIKGKVHDSEGKPLSEIQINVHDKDFPLHEHMLASTNSNKEGIFEIRFKESDFMHLFKRQPHVYFEIIDTNKSFQYVRDSLKDYDKKNNDTYTIWRSSIIDDVLNIDNYDITVVIKPRRVPEKYEAVVIGSGFGGTIISLTLANFFSKPNSSKKQNGLQIKIPSFNIFSGRSQRQNIEISSDESKKVKITNILFKHQHTGLRFTVNDPSDPKKEAKYPIDLDFTLINKNSVPLTVGLDGSNSNEVNLDVPVDVFISMDQASTPINLGVALHIENKRVCLLERGQWWISYEMPATLEGTLDEKPTIRQYLDENNVPYSFWAYPDNLKGLLALFGNTRDINGIRGLFDYRILQNVHVVTSSGVGGGSLVYFNITERPDQMVYQKWVTQDSDKPINKKYTYEEIYGANAINYVDSPADAKDTNKGIDYFGIAENFIGVNNITTTTSLGKFKLSRSRVFQNAAQKIQDTTGSILNKPIMDTKGKEKVDQNGNPILNFDVNLSITDIPNGLFAVENGNMRNPKISQVNKYSKQSNSCQRQGRCGLGCIPGARHTLNKQIHAAILEGKSIDVFPLCQVDTIEETGNSDHKYRINFRDYRDDNNGIKGIIETNLVILAAGTLGSTEILLRSKNLNKLQLSNKVGAHFSTNGDTFGVIHPTKENVDASRGPMQTSIVKFKNNNNDSSDFYFSIEDLGIPKMFGEVLPMIFKIMAFEKEAGKVLPTQNLVDMFTKIIIDRIRDPNTRSDLLKLVRSFNISASGILTDKMLRIINDINDMLLDDKTRNRSPDERVRDTLMLFGIGIDKPNSQLFIDRNDQINLHEPYSLGENSQPVIYSIIDTMRLFAREIGKNGEDSLFIPFWSNKNKVQITAHPLGGCSMGKDASSGVVDSFGKVFKGTSGELKYDGLYVVDGSIVQSPLGVNPSLTISALAFRIAEHITGDRKYWPA